MPLISRVKNGHLDSRGPAGIIVRGTLKHAWLNFDAAERASHSIHTTELA
jgi:hypothetical protein